MCDDRENIQFLLFLIGCGFGGLVATVLQILSSPPSDEDER